MLVIASMLAIFALLVFISMACAFSSWFSNVEFPPIPYDELFCAGVALVAIFIASAVAAFVYYRNKPKGCLDPEKCTEFKLVKRTKLSHNVARFRFALPAPTSVLGLPVGQHLRCRRKDSQGYEVVRSYTPITLDSDLGYFE